MSNYDQAWKEYKWRRNQFWIVFFCIFPVTGTVAYIGNKFHYIRIDLAMIAVAGAGLGAQRPVTRLAGRRNGGGE